MDDEKVDLDPDLTSSISDVLLSTKNDKTDANDSTPTSSTDAASSFSGASLNVSEDPISSTSSDVMEKDKLLPGIQTVNNENDPVVSKNLLGTDGDVDLLDMNIADVSSEPINEDVEDIVQDLENLLGEPEPRHDFPTRRKDKSPSEEEDLIASLDAPLDEKRKPNIIPETSDTQSSEKNEIDNLIQPESNNDQIAITEGSSNVVVECSLDESDTLPENQEVANTTPKEEIKCVEIEKTEDISCKSEELHETKPGQLEDITETEKIQKEAASATEENNPLLNENNEVNTVTSSEVDNDDKQEEPSHSTELNLVSSNEKKEVEVEEGAEILRYSEKIDKDTSIPVETKDQEFVTHDSIVIGVREAEENKICEGSESTPEENKSCEVAESKTEENKTSEVSESKPEENKSCQVSESKPEENKICEGSESKPEENKSCEVSESKAEENKTSEVSESKPQENKSCDVSESKAEENKCVEVPESKPEENKSCEVSESKPEGNKSCEVSESKAEENKSSELPESTPEENKSCEVSESKPEENKSSDVSESKAEGNNSCEVSESKPEENKSSEVSESKPEENESCQVSESKPEEKKSCEVSESKAEDEPHSLPTDQVSEDDQHVEAGKEIASSEKQFLVAESEKQVDEDKTSEVVVKYTDITATAEAENTLTSEEESVAPTDITATTEAGNIEILQSSVADPIKEPIASVLTVLENTSPEVLAVTEEITTEATPLLDELVDDLNPTPNEAVMEESVDDGAEVRDMPDGISVLGVETEVEVDQNVTSSSDLPKNQVCDVKETTSDNNIIENLEENSETHCEEPKEIIECIEPILAEAEEPVVPVSYDQNVEPMEETIPSDETPCEEIVEGIVEFPKSESTGEPVIEIATEETIVITDVSVSEGTLIKDEEIPDPPISIDDSTKSEDNSPKEEDITYIVEEKSESDPEDTIIEQPIILDNAVIPEESLDINNMPPTRKMEQKLKLASPEAISIEEITEQSIPNEEELIVNASLETQEDGLKGVNEDLVVPPRVENVQEEEMVERGDISTSETIETVDDASAANEDIDEVKDQKLESSCVENIKAVEPNIKEETSDTEAGENENSVEVMKGIDLHPIEEQTEEHQAVKEESTEGDMLKINEEEDNQILPTETDQEEIIAPSTSTEDCKQSESSDIAHLIPDISEVMEKQDEVKTFDKVSANEVIVEKIENSNQENVGVFEEVAESLNQKNIEEVSSSDATLGEVANFETPKEDTYNKSAKSDPESTPVVSDSVSKAELLGISFEDNENPELPKGSDTVGLDSATESCSITNQERMETKIEENIEPIELAEDEKVIDLQKSTEDDLVPVNEELCIKKVIVYEHKCDHHVTSESKITSNEEKEDNSSTQTSASMKETTDRELNDVACVKSEELVKEKATHGESDDIAALKTEETLSEKDQCVVDSSISIQVQKVEQNESSIPEISHAAKIEETTEEAKGNVVVNEQTFEQGEEFKESDVLEDDISNNQREEVSSSDQHDSQAEIITSESAGPDDLRVIVPSSSEILENTLEVSPVGGSVKEETEIVTVSEQIMEDQTTAAVQSILNNMLTEERSLEKVVEKEEPPVVHSSYSSYEVQKAVQEIQAITVDAVEISSEDIECISSSEKPFESEKIEFGNENCAETNIGSQSEVITQSSESEASECLIHSKSEDTQAIEISGSLASEEIFDEKVECAQKIIDSPLNNAENQDAITQSSCEPNQELDEDVRSPEEHSLLPSVDKCSSGISHINEPVVVPSIDLSEESSSEEDSDEDKKQNVVSSSVTSTSVIKESPSDSEDKDSKTLTPKHVLKSEKAASSTPMKNDPKKYSPRETRHSSRISERMKPLNSKEDINQPLSVNIEEIEKDKPYSPKITIKPIKEDEPNEDKEEHKGSLKITITKQSDNTHSILKMCSPEVEHRQKQSESEDQNVVPKLVIKTSDTHSDQHSPKMSTRSSRQVIPANSNIRSGSPRITIKPIIKPDSKETITSPLKITIKPIGKPEEFSRQQQRHSPKQMKNKADDEHYSTRSKVTKSSENSDVHSPKVTIKPVKPPEEAEVVSTPKITIKPIEKPEEARISPKITIKPVVRPVELDTEVEDEVKERIVLKINKGNLPPKDTERIGRESRKRELEDDKSEKLAKIKLKFSKDGDAHIVHKKDTEMQSCNKRQQDFETERSKRFKADVTMTDSDDDVKLIENTQSPIVISEDSQSQDSVILIEEVKDPLAEVATPEPKPQVTPVSAPRKRGRPRKVPLVVREEFGNEQKDKTTEATGSPVPVSSTNQLIETETTGRPKRSCRAQSVRDTLGIKPRKPSKPRGGKRGAGAKSISMKPEKEPGYSEEKITAIKKSLLTEGALQDAQSSGILKISSEIPPKKSEIKKEEPIQPLGLKSLLEAAKDQNIIEVIEIDTPSNSPKCLETIEIDKIEEESVIEEKPLEKISDTEKDIISTSENVSEIKDFEIQKEVLDLRDDGECIKESSDFGGTDAAASDVEMQPPTPVFAPPLSEASAVDISSTTDIAMFEEETRMSADVSSRAQTPAKQVVSADVVVEESQSSIQSTATTESGKISRRSRLEVHQDQDGSVFTADQLNEYYWGGNGPFMIQEQVAQYLGIKSFKRKYPGIPRRMVDMQERDYIRENGLASESMCDLGLTAVNSADILDIMYTDFQEKYEEFCRFQRDKQAKDLLNKQKALSMAANQEKSKLDILEQAVQSAAAYNANFNKTRREQRRACMDLQTMNIHYPKGKLKKINMPRIGNYPVAVVPGQFTDYYKEFTPTELNNLPLNTMLYTELHKILPDISDSDSDSSGSDSDDSSSSGSESNSSCEDNCKMCDKGSVTPRKSPVNSNM